MTGSRATPRAAALDSTSGTIYTLLAALGFAAVSTFTQLAMDRGPSLWAVLLWRFVVGTLVMGTYVVARRATPLSARDAGLWVVVGGGGQALIIGAALYSLRFVGVTTLAFLFFTYPAWVTLVQAIRGVERLTVTRVTALGLSLVGAIMIGGSPSAGDLAWQGVLLALGAAMLYALYIPLMHWMQRELSVPLTSTYAKFGSAVCFLVLALADGSAAVPLTSPAWPAILALAIFSTVLPAVFFMMGLVRLGPVRTAIMSTIEPFLTAVLGALVLRQGFSGRTLLGGVMIVAAVVLLQRRR